MQSQKHSFIVLSSIIVLISLFFAFDQADVQARRRWSPNSYTTYVFDSACRDGLDYEILIDKDEDSHNLQPFTIELEIKLFVDDYPSYDDNVSGDDLITWRDGSEQIFFENVQMVYSRSTTDDNIYVSSVRWDSVVEPGRMFLDPDILEWQAYESEGVPADDLPRIQDCFHNPEFPNIPPDPELVAVGSLVGPPFKCMDVLGPGIYNSSPTQLWDCTGETDQLWGLTDTGLIVHHSGKCLGVRNAYSTDGAVVDVYDCIDAVNQFWDVTDSGSIIDFHGKCLDTRDDNDTNGTPIQISTCAETDSQKWSFKTIPLANPEPATPTTNAIIGLDGKCLSVLDPPTYGTQVKLTTCADTVADNWEFVGDEIRYQGYCLEVGIPYLGNGQVAQLWSCLDEDNQKWTLTVDGELRGYSGQCLDVDESTQDEVQRVQIWACDGGAGQKWAKRDAATLSQPPLKGDVNCSDSVDGDDALFIVQYAIGQREETSYCPITTPHIYTHNGVADVNTDGAIDIYDALTLLECMWDFSNTFCPGDVAAANLESDAAAIEAREILIEKGLWAEEQSTHIFVPIMVETDDTFQD